MTTALVAPAIDLGCVAAYGLCGPRLVQRVSPAAATWVLTVCSVVAAAAGVTVLSLLALPLVGQDDTLADTAHWSAAVLAKDSFVGRGVAAAALVTLLVLVSRTVAASWRQLRAFREAARLAQQLGRTAGGLVVTPDDRVDVFALGGRARLVIATEGLMKSLPPGQRRAVLAHEHSHIAHRHHLHVCATTIAATLNPLLWRIPEATRFLVERWADEDSAKATSRAMTAIALENVAARAERRHPLAALAAATSSVIRRIAALQAAPQAAAPLPLVVPALLVVVAVAAAVVATDHVWDVFRLALAAGHRVLPHQH